MKAKGLFKDYLALLLPALAIILLDQWSKGVIRSTLAFGEVYMPDAWLSQYARILHWHNYGVFLGLFANLGIVSILLPLLISVGIIFYYPRISSQEKLVRLSMTLYLAGGIGNLIDRIRQGYVTDFVSVGSFPVWNIADASISLGVVVLIYALLQKEWAERKQPPGEELHE